MRPHRQADASPDNTVEYIVIPKLISSTGNRILSNKHVSQNIPDIQYVHCDHQISKIQILFILFSSFTNLFTSYGLILSAFSVRAFLSSLSSSKTAVLKLGLPKENSNMSVEKEALWHCVYCGMVYFK